MVLRMNRKEVGLMMKGFGLWVLFLMFGVSLMKGYSLFSGYGDAIMKVQLHQCRKLKVSHSVSLKYSENMKVDHHYEGDASNVDLLDYHQTDPVPSSKASIRHGPIQHDVPLMPYIPKPPPPVSSDHQPLP